jgi:hypothetical protein
MLHEDSAKPLFPSRSDDKIQVITDIPIAHQPSLLSVYKEGGYADENGSLPDRQETGIAARTEGTPPCLQPRRESEEAAPAKGFVSLPPEGNKACKGLFRDLVCAEGPLQVPTSVAAPPCL